MAYEGFDWKGYLAYAGYPEDQIPESVTDEELAQIRDHWARTVYQEELAIAAQDPFLETKKEREEQARDRLLALAPEYRQSFGLKEEQPAEAAFSADEFREHVVNNPVQDAPLDYYLKTFAAKRIGKNTKYEYPYLEGLTKKDFEDLFMERNGIDPDYTTIEDIRNGNFGPTWMAQRAEEESNLPKGSAMRQGWLNFKKLTGLTTETFGDALGIEWMQNIGKGITENAINTIEEEGYKSKYGESLVDTFKAQGPFAAAGKVLEMAQENWATTGVPLALAGMSALFGIAARNPRLAAQGLAGARASLAAATSADVAMGTGAAATVGRVGASTIAKSLAFASALSSGLEVGAVREELEEKSKEEGRQLYDPNDPGDVVAWGLLSAALDHVGNMMTFVGGGGLVRAAKGLVQTQQTRMLQAAEAAIRQAGKEAGKSWGRKIVEAMGTEGITEALQELPGIMAAKNKGVEYDAKEIRDRMIDAGVVGAFMGGGMRSVQALTERKPRTQSESDTTTTETQQTQTPPTNVPPAPNQPPPPGFEDKLAWNTNYSEIEDGKGWAAWDGYNVGYGASKDEASQNLLDQSNAGKDQITGTVTSSGNDSRVALAKGGELVVTGNGHKAVIQRIISLHNANDNFINLDSSKNHTFDAATLSGLSEKEFRKEIAQKWSNEAKPNRKSIKKAHTNQVDIAIKLDQQDGRAEFDLTAARSQLEAKGYRILKSKFEKSKSGKHTQNVWLYRDGQVYKLDLVTNGYNVTSNVTSVKNLFGDQQTGVIESDLKTQHIAYTDGGGSRKVLRNAVTISPAIREGGLQIQRDTTPSKEKLEFVNTEAIKKYVNTQGGKNIKIEGKKITYEVGNDKVRLDLRADGGIVVSENGRFLGAYDFDGSVLGNNIELATYDLTNDVTENLNFQIVDVPDGVRFNNNTIFVKDVESGSYYVISIDSKGSVTRTPVGNDPNGYLGRLESLKDIRTIEDIRRVYASQFRSGYVQVNTVRDSSGNIISREMVSKSTGGTTDNINDVDILTADRVNDIISNNQGFSLEENFVRVIGISQYTDSKTKGTAIIFDWVTLDDDRQVAAFIERSRGYGATLSDDGVGEPWNKPGEFIAEAGAFGGYDLYNDLRYNQDIERDLDSFTENEYRDDFKKVNAAISRIFSDMNSILNRAALNKTLNKSIINLYSQYISDLSNIHKSINASRLQRLPNQWNLANRKDDALKLRREFYRARLLQAKLHIDILKTQVNNRIRTGVLDNLASYNLNMTLDEVRSAAREVELIALRLEDEVIAQGDLRDRTSMASHIWRSIYPGNEGNYGSFIERIHNQGNDFRFSRDVNAPRAERHISLIDELRNHPFIGNGALSDLINDGKLIILETQQDIEDALLREGQAVPKFDQLGNIQGFASNDNMRVYLSSWGIKQGDAFRVLLHEMGAHTRRFGFSEAEFQEILAGIKANSTAQTPEGDHIRHAMWRAQNAKVSPNDPHYWEEVAAYLVEGSNEFAGLGVLDTMQAWVKRWLFTNGYIDATNFHYQDFTIFSLGMLRDSRIPLRLLNGKFDYSRHQNRIYDTRKFVESYVTEDIAKQLGYTREEVIEMVAAHLAGTYKAGNHVIGDLPDEEELMSHFSTIDADWRAFDRDDSASDLRFSRDVETAIAEMQKEIEEAEKQYNDVYEKYKNTPEFLKVRLPDGSLVNSNLNERQWVQVRTKNFKDWFGDWENNPENSSKVVDENGEPKVVYHAVGKGKAEGADTSFTVFDRRYAPFGFMFSDNKAFAESWAKRGWVEGNRIIPSFLNIRNDYTTDAEGKSWIHLKNPMLDDGWNFEDEEEWSSLEESDKRLTEELRGAKKQYITVDGISHYIEKYRKPIEDNEYGIIIKNVNEGFETSQTDYIVYDSYQINSAVDNVGLFGRTGSRDIRFSRSVPNGMQNQADVIYPDASEKINTIRYSRQSAEDILKEERADFSPEQIKVILDELDSYDGAKKEVEKKQKIVLNWVIKGQLELPEDKYKIDPAIKYARIMGYDTSTLSPQKIINKYQKSRPEGTPIRLGQLENFKDEEGNLIFTDPVNHGNGIVSYEVQDSRVGQEAMRKIMNSHWGKNQSPWCLLRANNQGELQDQAWKFWSETYTGLPKRVAFKKGNLISFMATDFKYHIKFKSEDELLDMIWGDDNAHRYATHIKDRSDVAREFLKYRDIFERLDIYERVSRQINKALTHYNFSGEVGDELLSVLPESMSERIKDVIKRRGVFFIEDGEVEEWRSTIDSLRDKFENGYREALNNWEKWFYKEGVRIIYVNNGDIAIVSDNVGYPIIVDWVEVQDFKRQEDGTYKNIIKERWWDRDNESHPDLEWAKDYSIGGLRYSITDEIAQQPTTPEQGTAIPNAPGMYKMRNGTIQAHPEYIPPGLETETAIYAAVAISDIAKNEPGLEDVRAMINADEVLREEVLAELSQRGIEDTPNNEFLYAIRNVLQTREPEDPTYQAIVDVFHDAITKATGGIQDDILLTDSDIAAAAHAITNTPFEPLIGEPVPTVPTPKPTIFDMLETRRLMREEAVNNAVDMVEPDENGRPVIRFSMSGVDLELDGNTIDRLDLHNRLSTIYGATHQYSEWDTFYANQLALAQQTGTHEVRDYGDLALPADQNRNVVDQFIAMLPTYIQNKIQVEWVDTTDARNNLAGGLASFRVDTTSADKLIYVQGFGGRTLGQVIRSIAWEASRFGWNLGVVKQLIPAVTQFYDLHESVIHRELAPYYAQRNLTPGTLKPKDKVFLVQTYFAKMNQDILTGRPNALAAQIGIDPADYQRIHDAVKTGFNDTVSDFTNIIMNNTNLNGNPEVAKAFSEDILRIVLGGMYGRGANFVYDEGTSGNHKIYCYTNNYGVRRRVIPKDGDKENRHYQVAQEIRANIEWWSGKFGKWGEWFARFFLRNFPMHNYLSFLHLDVPSARLGDTTTTKATNIINRAWQKISDPHGTRIRRELTLMNEIHSILRHHRFDPRWAENSVRGYESLFRNLGITDAKSIETARAADAALPNLEQLIAENAVTIRKTFAETIDSLANHMQAAGTISQEEIERMVQRMNDYAEKFMDDYEHRTYEAYSVDGLDELIAMNHDLNIDPNTGELTIDRKAVAAVKFITDTEQRLGGRTAEFYKQTEEARNIVRRRDRLNALYRYKEGKLRGAHTNLTAAALREKIVQEMNSEISLLIQNLNEAKSESVSYRKFNNIEGAKRRKLDERNNLDREYMKFLGLVEDPFMNAIYSIDEQYKVIEKLLLNRDLGEHILSSGMGNLVGTPLLEGQNEEGVAKIAHLEKGTFLEYVRVDPVFQKEISKEFEVIQKVYDGVLGGVVDIWKANNTVYSLKLGINNYVGNFSMLLATGHLYRMGSWFEAGAVTKKQFLDRFTDNSGNLSAFAEKIYDEMKQYNVSGGTISEMNVLSYGRGGHEKVLHEILSFINKANSASERGTFKLESAVGDFLERMREFYSFGDEWVKPLIYMNNRANAIAKYKAQIDPNDPRFAGDRNKWLQAVEEKALPEAAEQTIRETVSWENSPMFVRQLSQKSQRLFTPDFLMHNFQMLRITASNYTRLFSAIQELANLEVTNERQADYRDMLVKEIAQRSVGGAMTAATYLALAGMLSGSVLAIVPYMVNVLFKNIEGEGGDDEDKKGMFFDPQEWEGAQRLMNYKTGGNNLFVPVFRAGDKIYAWNYVRSSVMLTHAPVMPPTDNPDLLDRAGIAFKNIADLSNGTMTQQLINNMMGRDRFGREIGLGKGWLQVMERTLVPGFARQLAGVTFGYPPTDNMFHEGRLIKVPDLLGITVNAYDPRDIANHLAYDINSHNSDRNIHRRNFVEQLLKSDELSDRQIVNMITRMRERNAEDLDKVNYVVTGLRQVGMSDQEITHWLTNNRKTGGNALARKHAVGLLKGKDIYDEALVTTLVNKRKELNQSQQNLRMSKEELAVVTRNLDRAIRMYKQALREQ